MLLPDPSAVFSIPFRHHGTPSFGGELEALNRQPCGIDRFIGDDANLLLRVFASDAAESSPPLPVQADHNWPLVLFGPSGTGKTSLALTLVARISAFDKWLAMSGADFDRRFRASLAADAVEEFRHRIGNSPCLLIDDVQQLVDKVAVQQELAQTIDQLIAQQRPVILTMDQSPLLSNGLIPQLTSRLTGGLSIPLQGPGAAARSVIIRDFCRIHSVNLSPESVSWLTDRLNCSVPKIGHFFGQLKAAIRSAQANNGPHENNGHLQSTPLIEQAFIRRLFQRPTDDQERLGNTIVQTVAREFKLKPADLSSNSRKQSIVFARSVTVYLLRKLLGLSFLKIGAFLGNRDHSTIMHAHRKMQHLMKVRPLTTPCRELAHQNKIQLLEQRLHNLLAGDIDLVG